MPDSGDDGGCCDDDEGPAKAEHVFIFGLLWAMLGAVLWRIWRGPPALLNLGE